jgi:hypothetical protein
MTSLQPGHDGSQSFVGIGLRSFMQRLQSGFLNKNDMKKTTNLNRYGIWIDHKQATIMCVDGEGKLSSRTIKSGIRTMNRFDGETTSKTGLFRHTLNRETHDQNRKNQEFKKFLKEVVMNLEHVNGILILGPGDGRHELLNEIQKQKSLESVWIENKPADKMKVTEMKVVVKEHFGIS